MNQAPLMRTLCRLGCLLMLALGLGWMPGKAAAAVNCSSSSQSVTLPNVSVSPSTPVGTLLGSPQTVTMSYSCSGLPYDNSTQGQTVTIQAGGTLAPLDSTNNPNGPGITFKTNVAGIALRVTASPVQASSNSCLRCGPGSSAGFEDGTITYPSSGTSESFTLQLIKTGPVTPGTITGINLIPFWWYIYGKTNSVSLNANLILNGGTQVSLLACSVNTDSQNLTVTLPTVSTGALATSGATAGRTPFKINLTCQSGLTVSITMSTANPASATGVIAPTTGSSYAKNVGVQVLNSGGTPVTFNSAQTVGASPNGTLTIPFFAQYYATAAPTGSGQVAGTATFTMSYQ